MFIPFSARFPQQEASSPPCVRVALCKTQLAVIPRLPSHVLVACSDRDAEISPRPRLGSLVSDRSCGSVAHHALSRWRLYGVKHRGAGLPRAHSQLEPQLRPQLVSWKPPVLPGVLDSIMIWRHNNDCQVCQTGLELTARVAYGALMKPKTRKKVVRAIEKRLTEILRETSAEDDLSDIKDERDRETWRRGSFQITLSDELRSDLENALKRRPEPMPKQLNNFLNEMAVIDADSLLRPSLRHLARKLPPFPPGKQPKLNSGQQKKALAEVALLSSRSAFSRKEIYRKIAKRYGVHWRTIQNLATRTHKQRQKEV